jgi:hypothetical protein
MYIQCNIMTHFHNIFTSSPILTAQYNLTQIYISGISEFLELLLS